MIEQLLDSLLLPPSPPESADVFGPGRSEDEVERSPYQRNEHDDRDPGCFATTGYVTTLHQIYYGIDR